MALKEKPFSSAADARAQSCADDHEAEAAGNCVGEEIERGDLRTPIRPLMETIAVLRPASFRPTSSVAKLFALGDDFPPDCLLARMSQRWSFYRIAHIAL